MGMVLFGTSENKRASVPLTSRAHHWESARRRGTERAFSGEYNNRDKGLYRCICCDNALFSFDTSVIQGQDGVVSGLRLRREVSGNQLTPA